MFLDFICLVSLFLIPWLLWASEHSGLKTSVFGLRDMAQWLRALAVLVEGLGLVPGTHVQLTTVCNSSLRRSNILFRPPQPCMDSVHRYIQANTHVQKQVNLENSVWIPKLVFYLPFSALNCIVTNYRDCNRHLQYTVYFKLIFDYIHQNMGWSRDIVQLTKNLEVLGSIPCTTQTGSDGFYR